jgi:CheY-like chemotaxis protein
MAESKILLVDDDEDYATSMAELLEGEGLGEILVARNGKEALTVLRELHEPPCMILLDLAMPKMDGRVHSSSSFSMDGRELLGKLEGKLSEIPVIVCSGQKPVQSPQVVAQLSKPVDIEKLLELCTRLARRRDG